MLGRLTPDRDRVRVQVNSHRRLARLLQILVDIVLDFRSPLHSAASAAEGSTAEAFRLESLLRQLEYQAGLAAARGERPIDAEWLRTELGLTAPLSERLRVTTAFGEP